VIETNPGDSYWVCTAFVEQYGLFVPFCNTAQIVRLKSSPAGSSATAQVKVKNWSAGAKTFHGGLELPLLVWVVVQGPTATAPPPPFAPE
jgi:hypothetical protein